MMQHITPESLNDLPSRIAYLRQFIGFTADDAAALHAARDVVEPLVPAVVDAVYAKLLSFDITAQSFVPRQTGYTGEVPVSLKDLTLEHAQILFRKDFLKGYLGKLVSMDYEKLQTWEYLDKVGLMHTGVTGAFKHRSGKPPLRVEYIHCAILLGYVEDILVDAVVTHPELDIATKNAVARAANKASSFFFFHSHEILWIQNDLFARHYIKETVIEPEDTIIVKKSMAATAALVLLAVGAIGAQRFLRR